MKLRGSALGVDRWHQPAPTACYRIPELFRYLPRRHTTEVAKSKVATERNRSAGSHAIRIEIELPAEDNECEDHLLLPN